MPNKSTPDPMVLLVLPWPVARVPLDAPRVLYANAWAHSTPAAAIPDTPVRLREDA